MTTPSTTPTSTPIPSTNIQDFKFNSELLDILVNASQEEVSSRLGVPLQTWRGILVLMQAQVDRVTEAADDAVIEVEGVVVSISDVLALATEKANEASTSASEASTSAASASTSASEASTSAASASTSASEAESSKVEIEAKLEAYNQTVFEDVEEAALSFVDDAGAIAMQISKRGKVTAHGLQSVNEADHGRVAYGVADAAGRMAYGVTGKGNFFAGQLELDTRSYGKKDTGTDLVYAIMDEDGRIAFGIDPTTGQIAMSRVGELPPADVSALYALGARGTLLDAFDYDETFYQYTTDALGSVLPVKRKKVGDGRAHMLDTSDEVGIHVSYGQSWRSMAFDGFEQFVGYPESEMYVTPYKSGGSIEGPITSGAGISIGGTITDLANITTNEQISIGRAAVVSFLRWRDQVRGRKEVVAEFCHAYPGSSWDDGGGGGLAPGGVSWTNGLTIMAALEEQIEAYGKTPAYKSVAWTQGGSASKDQAGNEADLLAMMQAYDDLDLPGAGTDGLNFYIGLPPGNGNTVDMPEGAKAWLAVCRANANGRSWLTTPWYPWEYQQADPADNIHTGPYGMARHGEMEGYAKFCVEVLGLDWNPLWHSLTDAITASGNQVVVQFDRPSGPAFAQGSLVWETDEIEAAPDYGFCVYVDGVKATITDIEITGTGRDAVTMTLDSALTTGASVEVSYAGRDGTAQPAGTHAGLWGNLLMRGGTSPLNPAWTVDAWACQFIETVTAE